MKRSLLSAFVLVGCAVPSTALEDGEPAETRSEALTMAVPSGAFSPAPVPVVTLDRDVLARLRLPDFARTCGDDAPIPRRFVTWRPGCRAIAGAGGLWSARPVADGRSSDLCEVSWSSFRVSFVPGGAPPKPAAPDYASLAEHARSSPLSFVPGASIVAICGDASAASSSAYGARTVVSKFLRGPRPLDMAGCGACAFATDGDLYATLPVDWISDDVRFVVGTYDVEVEAAGSQLLVVRGAAGRLTGPIGIERIR